MVSKARREQRKGTWALSRGWLLETSQAVLGLQAGFAVLPQRKPFSVPSRGQNSWKFMVTAAHLDPVASLTSS